MEIQGILTKVCPVETVGQKGWQKRVFVIHVEHEKYPYDLAFTLGGEGNVNKVNEGMVNQPVTVAFDIKSREWNGKWFTEASAFAVNVVQQNAPQPQQQQVYYQNQPQQQAVPVQNPQAVYQQPQQQVPLNTQQGGSLPF